MTAVFQILKTVQGQDQDRFGQDHAAVKKLINFSPKKLGKDEIG